MSLLLKITLATCSVSLLPFLLIKYFLGFKIPGIHFAFIGIVILVKLATDKKLTNKYLTKHIGHQISKNELAGKINKIRNTKDIILVNIALTIFIIEILK